LSRALVRRFNNAGADDTVLSKDTRRRRYERGGPISDATARGDHFHVVRLMTPSALMAATRCRRRRGSRRRRRRRRRGFLRRGAADVAGRPQALLKLQQLAHEIQIGTDDWTYVFH